MKIDDLMYTLAEIRANKGNLDVAIDVTCTDDYYSGVYKADEIIVGADGVVLISCWDKN